MNGGFPPLILKDNKKISNNNKERFVSSTIKNNINIKKILETKNTTNILEKDNSIVNNLDIVTSL